MVPLTFLGSDWTGEWQPRDNQNLVNTLDDVAKRPGSLVVLDLYPASCLRLAHGQFVFASEHLKAKMPRSERGVLAEGLLDQYFVNGMDLPNIVTAPLRGEPQVTLGHPGATVRAAAYCCSIQELHQAGVDTIAEERERDRERKLDEDSS